MTHTLSRELLIPRLELRQSCISLPTTTRGKLDVDPPPVKLRLVQTERGL